jgi:hypothetical protein
MMWVAAHSTHGTVAGVCVILMPSSRCATNRQACSALRDPCSAQRAALHRWYKCPGVTD